MKDKYTVVFATPEMMIPELPEPACGANFRGGLGILAGDVMEGLAKRGVQAIGIVPLYQLHWVTKEDISATVSALPLRCVAEVLGRKIEAKEVNRGGILVLGIWAPEVFNVLYTPDRWQRLQQEALLGHAVPAVLKTLGIKPDIVWLNEGHTAVTIPAMKEEAYFAGAKFLFTTHTPVSEGMEKFPGDDWWFNALGISEKYRSIFIKGGIDMTNAAIILSDWVNGVSQEHCEVTQKMFPEFVSKIVGITNGSSRELWLSYYLKALGERFTLAGFVRAQRASKKELLGFIKKRTGIKFDSKKPLLGWVRRMAWYKQQYPMLNPILRAICAEKGQIVETELGKLEGLGFQVFSAGRAHESDSTCLGWMGKFQEQMSEPELSGKFIFIPEYNLELLKLAAQGCDVWFSCPLPKWEACGTGDQRAAINGKINLTTQAGGAKEYILEYNPVTGEGNGFFIEPYEPSQVYNKLRIISDLYYDWMAGKDGRWLELMRASFEAGKGLDILQATKQYEKIFENLLG
ncbi:MAG: hypothetical protein COV69_00800 [Parcubacteria group bacterium CG11_big_fil_rev_8_21_14_0_20_39_14]|nr:MAG: hypothetical protein COV69_00800 [Parcubacteria group bacterium CG11_big_fil_rev_8_21_14_0_20_39_14]PIS35740.1 MAG: hypothetical protein COT36_00735 [Parcubacteria group bacterium CG08_land_8_20_14_0_20_38_56]